MRQVLTYLNSMYVNLCSSATMSADLHKWRRYKLSILLPFQQVRLTLIPGPHYLPDTEVRYLPHTSFKSQVSLGSRLACESQKLLHLPARGSGQDFIFSVFTGSVMIPSANTMWPRKDTSLQQNTHFAGRFQLQTSFSKRIKQVSQIFQVSIKTSPNYNHIVLVD